MSGEQETVIANGTSTFALFPGSIASMGGYRREIRATTHWLKYLLPPSILTVMAAGKIFLPRTGYTYLNLGPIRQKPRRIAQNPGRQPSGQMPRGIRVAVGIKHQQRVI